MWTNGKQKEVFRKYVDDKGNLAFMDYNDIPSADGNLDDINRPKANQKRYEAFLLEQQALEIMDNEVIYAK